MKKGYLWLTILVLLLIASAWMYKEYNRQRTDTRYQQPKFETTAAAILDEFILDEKSAEAKYAGLDVIVAVTGIVKEVADDRNGHLTLVMGDAETLSSVRCAMDTSFRIEPAAVVRGMALKVKGNFNGYKADDLGIGADIEMNFCVIDSPKIKMRTR